MSDLKTTLRLPAPLAQDATSHAAGLGISLNALCAVALRDYLDARTSRRAGGEPEAQLQRSTASVTAPVVSAVPKVAKGQPCPCGSRKPYGKCHGRASA